MTVASSFSLDATPLRIEFGERAVTRLAELVQQLGHSQAFVVTDRAMLDTPVIPEVLRVLDDGGVAHQVFAGVTPNPTVGLMDEAGEALRRFGPAVVVAVGGGSSLDASKGIALVGANGGSARDFQFSGPPAAPALPVIAIPTTAGTGSETNSWGVIDDPEHRCKIYVGDASATPRVSILDPLLTVGLPPRATAATGIDALVHGVEALTSRGRNPIGEAYAHQAVRLVSRWLPAAMSNGSDVEARSGMLLGAHLAGLALTANGLGLVHGLAHSVSAHVGAVHGEALAAVLAEVMDYNLPTVTPEYAAVAVDLGLARDNGQEGDRERSARLAIDNVRALAEEVGARRRLRDLGVEQDMHASIAATALADSVTGNNPRTPQQDEVESLVAAAH
ncbi:MAG: iron-containing alcohol dehydrogenase family protein [Actinomycetes bacterium]